MYPESFVKSPRADLFWDLWNHDSLWNANQERSWLAGPVILFHFKRKSSHFVFIRQSIITYNTHLWSVVGSKMVMPWSGCFAYGSTEQWCNNPAKRSKSILPQDVQEEERWSKSHRTVSSQFVSWTATAEHFQIISDIKRCFKTYTNWTYVSPMAAYVRLFRSSILIHIVSNK